MRRSKSKRRSKPQGLRADVAAQVKAMAEKMITDDLNAQAQQHIKRAAAGGK
jgi:hypothetical protein